MKEMVLIEVVEKEKVVIEVDFATVVVLTENAK